MAAFNQLSDTERMKQQSLHRRQPPAAFIPGCRAGATVEHLCIQLGHRSSERARESVWTQQQEEGGIGNPAAPTTPLPHTRDLPAGSQWGSGSPSHWFGCPAEETRGVTGSPKDDPGGIRGFFCESAGQARAALHDL